ncbi:hypothetical protein PVAND_002762 [Polypedilum vanderplanki]|uniref:F-box domain-containing protein n=1 Tax=Polypedilum vanderplanki TaxID=319348 RepID=A0A9J6BRZ4_POLVA|nr:hypothetical protein PVAND_002762 [Polypedilum vanderplanki]
MEINKLPPELLIQIFNYMPEMIVNVAKVCKYFNVIATSQIKNLSIIFERESEEKIISISDELNNFKSIHNMKLACSLDVNIAEKADFCAMHSNKITHLILSDFSFLNPFFDQHDVIFTKLHTLEIINSDLTSSSEELPSFILKTCIALKNLKISGCSGLEIESLNEIGRNLCNTKIEKIELHPTYSYYDMRNIDESWTIENLKTLSVRSKLVVMKKNFVRNMLGNRRKSLNLKRLELIAELHFGSNFISTILQQFPNLEHLAIGKGVTEIRNNDFTDICNQYNQLKTLEYHFIHHDENLELKHRLNVNESLQSLTIGITKIINFNDLTRISKSFPNLKKLSLIVYYVISSNEEYIKRIIKIFPHIKEFNLNHIGQLENIKIILN